MDLVTGQVAKQQRQISALIDVCAAQSEQLRLLGMFHSKERPLKSDWDRESFNSESHLYVARNS